MVIYYSDDAIESIDICCKMMARDAFTQSRLISMEWRDDKPVMMIEDQVINYCPFCGVIVTVRLKN